MLELKLVHVTCSCVEKYSFAANSGNSLRNSTLRYVYNLGQNIWRLFYVLAQFLFTTSETILDYHHQKVNVRIVSHEVPNDMDLMVSTQPTIRKANFDICAKKLWKICCKIFHRAKVWVNVVNISYNLNIVQDSSRPTWYFLEYNQPQHFSIPPTLAYHPSHPCYKVTHASKPPTLPTLAQHSG